MSDLTVGEVNHRLRKLYDKDYITSFTLTADVMFVGVEGKEELPERVENIVEALGLVESRINYNPKLDQTVYEFNRGDNPNESYN